MRKISKYKLYKTSKFILSTFYYRILRFKRTKWSFLKREIKNIIRFKKKSLRLARKKAFKYKYKYKSKFFAKKNIQKKPVILRKKKKLKKKKKNYKRNI
jgi:hypothetical protein